MPSGSTKLPSDRSAVHDAFISYSRTDVKFARMLKRCLEAYRPPKQLDLPQRTLGVFLDEKDLVGPEYGQAINIALHGSAKLIVVCSPTARQSVYVNDEIKRFSRIRHSKDIIPIILSGIPNNEVEPGHESDAAFPPALCEAHETPLAVDYRGFPEESKGLDQSEYEDSWYGLLANIYGIDRATLERRDTVRKRSRNRVIGLGTLLVLGVVLALSVFGLQSRSARRATEFAIRLVESARSAHDPLVTGLLLSELRELDERYWPRRGLGLAHETARSSIPRSVLRHSTDERVLARFAPDGTKVAIAADGRLRIWKDDWSSPSLSFDYELPAKRIAFSPDGSRIMLSGGPKSFVRSVDGTGGTTFFEDNSAWHEPEFGPHGNRVLSIFRRAAYVRNLETGEVRRLEPEAPQLFPDVAKLSPDSRRVATASYKGVVVWDLESSADPYVIAHGDRHDRPYKISFSPDGTRLMSASEKEVRVWQVDNLDSVCVLDHRDSSDRWVQFDDAFYSPDGTRIITLTNRGLACVWSADGAGDRTELNEDSYAESILVDPTGTFLVTNHNTRFVVWPVDSSQEPYEARHAAPGSPWEFSSDGMTVVTLYGSFAKIWRLEDPRNSIDLQHPNEVVTAEFSSDGTSVLTTCKDGIVRLWPSKGAREPVEIPHGETHHALPVYLSNSGLHIAERRNGTLEIRNLNGNRVMKVEGEAIGNPFSSDGSHVIALSPLDGVTVTGVNGAGEPIALGSMRTREVHTASLGPNGVSIVTTSRDDSIHVWSLNDVSEPIYSLYIRHAHRAILGPNGKYVFVTTKDEREAGDAYVCSLKQSADFVRLPHDGYVRSALFNSDGSRVVTVGGTIVMEHIENWGEDGFPFDSYADSLVVGTLGGTARVWNTDGGPPTILEHGDGWDVNTACFSPDGLSILTSSNDATARIWGVEDSDTTILKHDSNVLSASFSPDGERVITTTFLGKAHVWNIDGVGEPLVLDHGEQIDSATFTSDGLKVVTVSYNATKVWRVHWRSILDYLEESTTACLTPNERMHFLKESEKVAQVKYQECKGLE